MNNCKFYPEITNCVDCNYFDVVETDTDFKVVCLKYEEESNERTKDVRRVAAEFCKNSS